MKSFKQHLDERCWSGYKPTPGKKAYSKGSCVKEEVEELEEGNQPKTEKKPSKNKNVKRPEVATFSHMIDLRHLNLLKKPKKMAKEEVEELEEERPGLWANIRAKRARGERMRKPGEKGAPTDAQIKAIRNEEVEYINEASFTSATSMYAATRKQSGNKTEQPTHNIRVGDTVKTKDNKKGSVVFVNGDEVHVKGTNSYYPNAIQHHSSSDLKKEEIELDEGEAWTRKEGQSESGGLNRKGIESYRRANPGSKLSMAVTTKPSKLKAGSKAANRRKSFCARMGGMKKRLTSAKTANDPDSRINKSLRKWNC
jgi:hypothetical protein